MSNILEEVQQYVADKLNADPQLSACHFIAENRRDVEFEIKQALGKQGVVGLVMTPKATFAGAYMDTSLAWQLDELEIDIVENVLVNRGKNGGGYITGQDAAMRLFDVLCPLSGEGEGKFCPVSYDEGEDGSLLVNKCILKCLVHVSEPEPEPFKPKGKVLYKTDLSQEDWLEEDAYLSGDNVLYGFEHKKQAAVAMLPDFAADGTPVKALGDHSLQDCKSLVSVDLPSALVSLGVYSMHDCESLLHLHLPDSVSCIAERAVSYCDSLSSVDMPSSLQLLGSNCFRNDPELLSICVPGCEVLQETFVDCKKLSSFELGEGALATPYRMFLNCSALVEVKLPSTLTSIGDLTFTRCYALSSIDMPSCLVSIGQGAFSTCTSLTGAVVPESVSSIGHNAFSSCSSAVSRGFLFKGKTMTQVRAMADYSWGLHPSKISAEPVVPTHVEYVDGSSWEGSIVGQLTWRDIPNRENLVAVAIGNSVTSIGNSAFKNCYLLTGISLPDTVQSIAEDAFAEDPNIEVTFQGRTKAEVQAMDNYPWGIENTQNIHSIIGPNTRVKYGWSQSWDSLPLSGTLNSNDLPSRDGIRYIGIGSSIDEIGYRAFSGMEFLTGVEIPTTVTAIGAWAFSGAEGMTDIEIPSSVSSIGSDAFLGCHILSSVMFEGKTLEQVQAMANYPWGIRNTSIISAELG